MTDKKQKNRIQIAKEAYVLAHEEWKAAADKYYTARKKYMKLLDDSFERQDLYRPITPKD